MIAIALNDVSARILVLRACWYPNLAWPSAKEEARSDSRTGPFPTAVPYAATCFVMGTVLISIFFGSATAATGAVISSTPFSNSALIFPHFTPSGSPSVLSNSRRRTSLWK